MKHTTKTTKAFLTTNKGRRTTEPRSLLSIANKVIITQFQWQHDILLKAKRKNFNHRAKNSKHSISEITPIMRVLHF